MKDPGPGSVAQRTLQLRRSTGPRRSLAQLIELLPKAFEAEFLEFSFEQSGFSALVLDAKLAADDTELLSAYPRDVDGACRKTLTPLCRGKKALTKYPNARTYSRHHPKCSGAPQTPSEWPDGQRH